MQAAKWTASMLSLALVLTLRRRKRRKTVDDIWQEWRKFQESVLDVDVSRMTLEESQAQYQTYLSALQMLTDYGSGPCDGKAARKLRSEIGGLESKLFKTASDRDSYIQERVAGRAWLHSFQAAPLAAGLIAQVHQGEMSDGTRVALKIRHEHIYHQLLHQYHSFITFAEFLQESGHPLGVTATGVLHKFVELLKDETDLRNEATQMATFSQILQRLPATFPLLHIPRVLPEVSSEDVLVMEYIHGIPLMDSLHAIQGDQLKLMEALVQFFGVLILKEGRFLCDPHASNFMIRRDPDTSQPQLVLLDFGQVTQLPQPTRLTLCHIIHALSNQNGPELIQARLQLAPEGLFSAPLWSFLVRYGLPSTSHSCPKVDVGHVQLPLEYYFVIRAIRILRNLLEALDLKVSSVQLWSEIAEEVSSEFSAAEGKSGPSEATEGRNRLECELDFTFRLI